MNEIKKEWVKPHLTKHLRNDIDILTGKGTLMTEAGTAGPLAS